MLIHKSIFTTGAMAASITPSSLTSTSVTISWSSQPAQFRLPVFEYTVSLTQVTGSGQALCPGIIDSRRPVVTATNTSMSFIGLEEFSTYTVTVTTTFNVFGSNMDVASDMMFTTSSAGMDTRRIVVITCTCFLQCLYHAWLCVDQLISSDLSSM